MKFLKFLTQKRQAGDDILARAEDLGGPPPATALAKWFGGMVCPLALFFYGLSCCLTKEGILFGDNGALELHGKFALAMGMAWNFAAFFLHAHFFWGNVQKLGAYSEIAKIISAAGFIVCYGLVVWSILTDW